MDMGSRLTEKEVEGLGLVRADWKTIQENEIEEVYIRAYPESPMYGPYRVVDAYDQIISKIDGTEQREYLRDKGLYVKYSPITETKGKVFGNSEQWLFLDEVSKAKEDYTPTAKWYDKDEKGRIVLDPRNPDHTKLILKALQQKILQEIDKKEQEVEELQNAEEILQGTLDKLE
jgi:hypothetical protein